MLQILTSSDCRLRALAADSGQAMPDDAVWIDLLRPTREEESFVEKALAVELPTREEMQEIEPSNRLYQEDGGLFMTANVLANTDSPAPESTAVTFVLLRQRLVTVRYAEPKAFRIFAGYVERHREVGAGGPSLLVGLLEAIVDRTADILERIGVDIDALSRSIFATDGSGGSQPGATRDFTDALTRIGRHHDLTSKARDSLVSLSRLLSFLTLPGDVRNDKELREHVRSLARDVASLTDHATFISGNISFLLNATLGLVNVEQNAIIKIFSVAAVVFLPPTLVASIYGMNFKLIPELGWDFGYAWALLLMVLSAVLPYLYFKRRGWL
ncbi:MAG TPA: magnesium transporter CorA family protein [Stellaceae bacterium]|nr:magnesium transporter CorA family protein [Stellaceae bacterium]